MYARAILQEKEIPRSTVFEMVEEPSCTLALQLRVLIRRLGVTQNAFADETDIDKAWLSRVLNNRDRRGLTKNKVDTIVGYLQLDFHHFIDDLEREGWRRSLQCRASLERTLRRMFPPSFDLGSELAFETVARMLPEVLQVWDATNGEAPMASPAKPKPNLSAFSEKQQFRLIANYWAFDSNHGVKWLDKYLKLSEQEFSEIEPLLALSLEDQANLSLDILSKSQYFDDHFKDLVSRRWLQTVAIRQGASLPE